MSDAQIAHIRQLAAARAKAYYERNKEKIAERRKAQRQACREALGKESPVAEPEPEKKLVAPKRVRRPVLAKPIPKEEPAPVATEPEPEKKLVAPKRVRRPVLAKPVLTFEKAEQIISESPAITSDESRKLYRNHLKTVKEILQCDNLVDCFQDAPKVIQTLNDAKQKRDPSKGYSVNSKKAYTQMILKLSDVLGITLSKETKQAYVDAFDVLKLDSKSETKARQEDAKESKEEALTFQEYLPKVKEHYGEESKEYLIASLYSLYGFRDDLQLRMVPKPDDKADNQLEYPTKTNKLKNYRIHLNRYKTDKKYGTKVIDIPKTLNNPITRYRIKHKLVDGSYLFGDKPLSGFVSNMNKAIGLPLTINNLRELHVAPVIEGMSSTDRVELAKKMNHSPATSEHYRAKKKPNASGSST